MKNVILLTIDALRRDALGCYGGKGGLSPFIDSIQDKCIRFTNTQSTGTYTESSFPGILTSSYYLDHGLSERSTKKLSPNRKLISEALKHEMIITAAFHSSPYLSNFFGWNRGWEKFHDGMDMPVTDKVPFVKASVVNKKVGEWLLSQKGRLAVRPFFLWVHYMDAHEPYIPERKYIDVVDPSISQTEDQMFALYKDVLLNRDVSDENVTKILKNLYLANVPIADNAVKEFFGILQEMDFLKDTVIIIGSDHGDEFGEHGGLSHDSKMYSELLNVPLMVYDPTLTKGQVIDTLVSTIDISPTIVNLFGLKPVEAFQGHSLLPTEDYPVKGVYGNAIDKHGLEWIEKGVHFYREGDLKIIYLEKEDTWELYDLKEDPKELSNIVDSSPAAEGMKEKLRPRIKKGE